MEELVYNGLGYIFSFQFLQGYSLCLVAKTFIILLPGITLLPGYLNYCLLPGLLYVFFNVPFNAVYPNPAR